MRVTLAHNWGLSLSDVDQLSYRQIGWLNDEAERRNRAQRHDSGIRSRPGTVNRHTPREGVDD